MKKIIDFIYELQGKLADMMDEEVKKGNVKVKDREKFDKNIKKIREKLEKRNREKSNNN